MGRSIPTVPFHIPSLCAFTLCAFTHRASQPTPMRISLLPRLSLTLALGLSAIVLLPACDSDEPNAEASVTVMTRNVYLGGDLFALLDPSCADVIPLCVNDLYVNGVVASDVPGRMGAIADEIENTSPDLVGLQEVTLYRRQSQSDYVTGTTTPNAQDVTFDFLQILLDTLNARGLDYRVAAENENADVEFPASANGQAFYDIRLTDRDVILARAGTETTVLKEENFDINAEIPIGGVTVEFTRGYSAVRATKDGVTFTFANAHLEVGGPSAPIQRFQAAALTAPTGLGNEAPLIFVGDFNADPDAEDIAQETDAYSDLVATFTDAWDTLRPTDDGPTCCQAADLQNDASLLDSRIDLVLYRGRVLPMSISRTGESASDQTETGLWPSDHAGVVATLTVEN